MNSKLSLGWHEESESPDIPEPIMPSGRQRHIREKAVDELSSLVIIFGYLWVVVELLSVRKSIVLSEYHLNCPEYAFAIINFLVFAKVVLTRNCVWDFVVKLSRHVSPKPHLSVRPISLWAGNTPQDSIPYLHYLSQETVVGSSYGQIVSPKVNDSPGANFHGDRQRARAGEMQKATTPKPKSDARRMV